MFLSSSGVRGAHRGAHGRAAAKNHVQSELEAEAVTSALLLRRGFEKSGPRMYLKAKWASNISSKELAFYPLESGAKRAKCL